jgi:osmotically-inducible protein OsmY
MVEKGWVTLIGEVEWEHQRASATNALCYLKGITGITNKINLKPKVSLISVKTDIAAAIKRQGLRDAPTITVDVRDATVILGGTVYSNAERDVARHSAWSTPGVHKIVDNMTCV